MLAPSITSIAAAMLLCETSFAQWSPDIIFDSPITTVEDTSVNDPVTPPATTTTTVIEPEIKTEEEELEEE